MQKELKRLEQLKLLLDVKVKELDEVDIRVEDIHNERIAAIEAKAQV
jgi:hypothetical protein